jgi:hypothetical protein
MGHPVLKRAAETIPDPSAPEIHRLVADMVDTLADATGLGLAAPQVHVPKRLVIFHLPASRARREEEKREMQQAKKYKDQARVGFGSQIRNYFLHPDQRVKDTRTGVSIGNFQSVLDGNIDTFLDAYLRWRIKANP